MNENCPETGENLIYKCDECDRKVDNEEQKFCMGCGEAYFERIVIPESVQAHLNSPFNFIDSRSCAGAVNDLDSELHDLRDFVNKRYE